MSRRTFAPLVAIHARRAVARAHALTRLAAFIPATMATMLFVVACVSAKRPSPPSPGVVAFAPRDAAPYQWPGKRRTRLRVWVEPSSAIAGWQRRHLELVDSALRAWSREGTVGFVRARRPKDADIRVHWTERLPAKHPGVTMLTPNRRGDLAVATVWVNVAADSRETATSDEVLYGVIAHEIGHALGLSHAQDRTRIMNPVLYRLSVTDEDVAALRPDQRVAGASRAGGSSAGATMSTVRPSAVTIRR